MDRQTDGQRNLMFYHLFYFLVTANNRTADAALQMNQLQQAAVKTTPCRSMPGRTATGFRALTVVTCKIKHLQKYFRAVDFPLRKNIVKMFYFTCNHGLNDCKR